MPNFPCRECDRVRKNAETDQVQMSSGPADVPDESPAQDLAEVVEKAPADSRIKVAREALSNTERQRKFREKDPEGYRAANALRMRRPLDHLRGCLLLGPGHQSPRRIIPDRHGR